MNEYTMSVPGDELERRVERFQARLSEKGISGALILQKTDFYYFTGTVQQGWLYIPVEGSPVMMVQKDYERACQESALDDILFLKTPKMIPGTLNERGFGTPAMIGMELDVLPVNLYRFFRNLFKKSEIADVSEDIRRIRSVKSEYEIHLVAQSSKAWEEWMAKAPEFIEEGISEIEAAGRFEGYARKLGHQGLIRMRMWEGELFYGHLMSGASAAAPSYLASPTGGFGAYPAFAQGAGLKLIQRNEPVLLDYTFAMNGYISDNTRIFALGALQDELMRAHDAMLAVQNKALEVAEPGIAAGDLYDTMVEEAGKNGMEEWFMGAPGKKIRFTGHGVGLELDEYPIIAKGQAMPLEKNMVIALEPKVIIPGKGVVGIENTFLVTETGLERFCSFGDSVCVL
ncbi:MAG: Xaa-Pro peptidase family protein [Desulfobacteraceae bacterium]